MEFHASSWNRIRCAAGADAGSDGWGDPGFAGGDYNLDGGSYNFDGGSYNLAGGSYNFDGGSYKKKTELEFCHPGYAE